MSQPVGTVLPDLTIIAAATAHLPGGDSVMQFAFWDTLSRYGDFYAKWFKQQWYAMGPLAYGVALIIIGVAGWLFMKSGTKRC